MLYSIWKPLKLSSNLHAKTIPKKPDNKHCQPDSNRYLWDPSRARYQLSHALTCKIKRKNFYISFTSPNRFCNVAETLSDTFPRWSSETSLKHCSELLLFNGSTETFLQRIPSGFQTRLRDEGPETFRTRLRITVYRATFQRRFQNVSIEPETVETFEMSLKRFWNRVCCMGSFCVSRVYRSWSLNLITIKITGFAWKSIPKNSPQNHI
jgi:hypothetical protein